VRDGGFSCRGLLDAAENDALEWQSLPRHERFFTPEPFRNVLPTWYLSCHARSLSGLARADARDTPGAFAVATDDSGVTILFSTLQVVSIDSTESLLEAILYAAEPTSPEQARAFAKDRIRRWLAGHHRASWGSRPTRART
jgi:hypothetical protein